jgi:hypothetical protein
VLTSEIHEPDALVAVGLRHDGYAGFHLEGEPDRKVTPELIAVWYAEEKQERAPAIAIIGKDKEPKA